MKNISFIGWLLFFSINAFAQKTITIEGQITDSLKKAVNSVNITITKGNNQVVAFSFSDEKGFYQIDFIPENVVKYKLVANSMGYEMLQTDIPLEKEHIVQNFVLKQKDLILKEVIVTEKIAIKEANDTTTYRADRFRDKNDKVIEDLLKKLPGFEISKNGNISVNGKSIDKILLEGDDLTNKNYKVVSKNLSADLVDKVQVIDKYVEDPLMKGVVSSNRQVLNLTFRTDRKSTLFGNADVGLGTSEKLDERINLISFTKKAKLYALGNYNTVGKDITGDGNLLEDALQQVNNDDLFQKNQKSEYVSINEIALPDFQSQQVNFNKALLLSPTFIVKPTTKFIIKGSGNCYSDRNILQENSSFIYLTAPPINVIENKSIIKKPTDYKGSIEAIFLPNAKSRIRLVGNWGDTFVNYDGNVLNNNQSNNQILANTKQTFESRLSYTQRLNENAVFNLEASHLENTLTQNYHVQSSQKHFVSFLNDSTTTLTQNLTNPYKSTAIVSQYLLKAGKTKLGVQTGINWVDEQLTSNLLLDKDSTSNRNRLAMTTFAIKAKLERAFNHFKLNIELPIHYTNFAYENSSTKKLPFLTPKVGLSFKKNDNSIDMLWTINSKPPQISDISKFYILTNYRNFQEGSNDFLQLNGQSFLVNYLHRNLFEQLFIYATFAYFKNTQLYNTTLQINNDFNASSLYGSKAGNDMYNISVGVTKFLTAIGSSIKLKGNVSLFNFQNQLNSAEIRNVQASNTKVEFGLRSAWKKWFNYHLGSEFNTNTQKVAENSGITNKTLASFAAFMFTFTPKLNAQLDFEQYSFPNSSTKIANFISSGISYEIKTNTLTLSLLSRNLTNNTSFEYNYINDYQKSYRNYNVLGRYFMLNANFRF